MHADSDAPTVATTTDPKRSPAADSPTTSPIQPHDEALRVLAVDTAVEAMEADPELSATRAAQMAGEAHGVSSRSVIRWAEQQRRPLTEYGRRAQVGAQAAREARYDSARRAQQRAAITVRIERELERIDQLQTDGEDASAALQRLAGAHARLTETQHRDELHAIRTGEIPPIMPEGYADDLPDGVVDISDALRRAQT